MAIQISRRLVKAKFFRGLSDESRLLILETLKNGPKTVGDLVQLTNLTQPNISNHLSCLKRCGLVTSVQTGRFVTYSLSRTEIHTLLDTADDLLNMCSGQINECDSIE